MAKRGVTRITDMRRFTGGESKVTQTSALGAGGGGGVANPNTRRDRPV
jgi:hypothetical protein